MSTGFVEELCPLQESRRSRDPLISGRNDEDSSIFRVDGRRRDQG